MSPRRPIEKASPEEVKTLLTEGFVQAVVHPSEWQAVSRYLAAYLDVDAVSVAGGSPGSNLEILAVHGVDESLVWRALRPIRPVVTREEPQARTQEALPLAPLGTASFRHQCAWWVWGSQEGCLVWVALHEAPEGRVQFAEDRLGCLDRMITSAVDGSVRLRRAELTSQHLQSTIDHLVVGAVVTDDTGRVVAMNRAANRALERSDDLGVVDSRLTADTRESTNRLRDVLAACRTDGATRTLRVGQSPVELLVASPSGPKPRAIVFLMPPDPGRIVHADHLRELYGLTNAEIRLVHRLLEGYSLSDAAFDLGVKRNTAHSQLKSVFQKTATHRQGDLIALLLRCPAAWHREPSGRSPSFPS